MTGKFKGGGREKQIVVISMDNEKASSKEVEKKK
jgi:hypothetical protein